MTNTTDPNRTNRTSPPEDRRYPFIVTCRECGGHWAPVPLSEYPVEMTVFAARMLEQAETSGCPTCGALRHNLVVDQSGKAQAWYDREVRGKETEAPHAAGE